jgi:DDE superfamily endonuclease
MTSNECCCHQSPLISDMCTLLEPHRRLSANQKAVNAAHARQRGPGERANAQLKAWRILRKIRCCPTRVTDLVKAVLLLIQAG